MEMIRLVDIDALVTKQFHQLTPMGAPLPVSPEHRTRSRWRRRVPWCRWGLTGDRRM